MAYLSIYEYTSEDSYTVKISGMTSGQKYHLFIEDLTASGDGNGYICQYSQTANTSTYTYTGSTSSTYSKYPRQVLLYTSGTTATTHRVGNRYYTTQKPFVFETGMTVQDNKDIPKWNPPAPTTYTYGYNIRWNNQQHQSYENWYSKPTEDSTATSYTMTLPTYYPSDYTYNGYTYRCVGFSTSASGSVNYTAGASITLYSTNPIPTLYCVWKKLLTLKVTAGTGISKIYGYWSDNPQTSVTISSGSTGTHTFVSSGYDYFYVSKVDFSIYYDHPIYWTAASGGKYKATNEDGSWNDHTITISDSDRSSTIEATYNPPVPITVSVNIIPKGSGTVTGTGSYVYGSRVELKASANTGYDFSGWETTDGTFISKETTLVLPSVTSDLELNANFSYHIYTEEYVTMTVNSSAADGKSVNFTATTSYSRLYARTVKIFSNQTQIGQATITSGNTSVTFNSYELTPNTDYNLVYVSMWYGSTKVGEMTGTTHAYSRFVTDWTRTFGALSIASNQPCTNMTHGAWNMFNQWMVQKAARHGRSYSSHSVNAGDRFLATYYNTCTDLLRVLYGAQSEIPTVVSGMQLLALYLNGLITYFNEEDN